MQSHTSIFKNRRSASVAVGIRISQTMFHFLCRAHQADLGAGMATPRGRCRFSFSAREIVGRIFVYHKQNENMEYQSECLRDVDNGI